MGEPISLAVTGAYRLIVLLMKVKEVCNTRSNNTAVLQELSTFVENLEQDLDLLRKKTPRNNTSVWAAVSLRDELNNAADYLKKCLKMRYFKSLWTAKEIEANLATVRETLVTSFQTTLQIVSLDVAIDEQKKQEEFRQNLSQMQKHNLEALGNVTSGLGNLTEAVTSMQQEVKESVKDMRSQRLEMVKLIVDAVADRLKEDSKFDLSHAIDEVRSTKAQTSDTEKFFADVPANLEKLRVQDVHVAPEGETWWFEDPLTRDVMCDPVKGTDGRTYDRWTFIDHDLVKCPYDASMKDFKIAFDDIDIRGRLFGRFPEKEQQFQLRRERHRLEALQHADKGQYADALAKLNHVLQWNRLDKECAQRRDEVQDLVRRILQPDVTTSPNTDAPQQPVTQPRSEPGTPSPSPTSAKEKLLDEESPERFFIGAQGGANWNPQARLEFAEDRLSVKVETDRGSSASLLANQCCPESSKGLPGYYFEVLFKSGRGVSIGFNVLSSKEVLQKWTVGGRAKEPGETVGFISYASSLQENVHGKGLKGEVFCCFQLENVEEDQVFGDAPLDTISCGDTVGAGINFHRREVFFTKNYQLRWIICNVSLKPGYGYVPSFGVDGPGAEIHVNFENPGQGPVLFAYEALVRADWRNSLFGRRVDVIYYGYESSEQEFRQVGRALDTKDWDSTAKEELRYKKISVGKVGAIAG